MSCLQPLSCCYVPASCLQLHFSQFNACFCCLPPELAALFIPEEEEEKEFHKLRPVNKTMSCAFASVMLVIHILGAIDKGGDCL